MRGRRDRARNTGGFEIPGSVQTSVDTGADCFSGRCCGGVDGLKLDRGELAQPSLPAFAVVLRLDPGHDRQPQFLPGAPPPGVENVLLQQRKERFHRGVVTTGTDPAHRPGKPMAAQQGPVGSRPELSTSVGVDHDIARVAQGNRVAQRADRE